jgi:hypothetical protein
MTGLERSLRGIAAALDALGHRWALVGGLAVAVQAEPRLTRDADVAVSVSDDAAAERVVHDLGGRGYRALSIVEHETQRRLSTVRLTDTPSDGGAVVDLLFASCGIEPEVVAAAEVISVLPDLLLPVARPGHLIVMKLLARDDRQRPTDADDLRALAAVATPDDWALAAGAAELVSARGFDRGRDLTAALRRLRDVGAYGDG